MSSSSIEHQLDVLLEACERSIGVMQGIVMSKRWDRLVEKESGFNSSMQQLQSFVESNQEVVNGMTGYIGRFERLAMQQRRVMRLMNSHMRGMSEDMARTDQVLRRLDHLSEGLGSN